LLRARREWPTGSSTANDGDEVPSPHGIFSLAENHLRVSLIRCSSESYAPQQNRLADVAFGSKADVTLLNFDVRFTPESGHSSPPSRGQLLAITELMHRGKQHRYVVAGKHPSRNRPGNLPHGSFIQYVLRERLCTFERKYRFALVILCRGGAMPLIARRPPAL